MTQPNTPAPPPEERAPSADATAGEPYPWLTDVRLFQDAAEKYANQARELRELFNDPKMGELSSAYANRFYALAKAAAAPCAECARLREAEAAIVLEYAEKYREKWQDRDDAYWLGALVEEVGELGAALNGEHHHTPELELRQISSIAINWLRKRARAALRAPSTQREE